MEEITKYERATNHRAKRLREEVALTLIAAGQADVVAVGGNFSSAYTPPSLTAAVPTGLS